MERQVVFGGAAPRGGWIARWGAGEQGGDRQRESRLSPSREDLGARFPQSRLE